MSRLDGSVLSAAVNVSRRTGVGVVGGLASRRTIDPVLSIKNPLLKYNGQRASPAVTAFSLPVES
jgi:hypothetical protein